VTLDPPDQWAGGVDHLQTSEVGLLEELGSCPVGGHHHLRAARVRQLVGSTEPPLLQFFKGSRVVHDLTEGDSLLTRAKGIGRQLQGVANPEAEAGVPGANGVHFRPSPKRRSVNGPKQSPVLTLLEADLSARYEI
jgi:hypothetical protein